PPPVRPQVKFTPPVIKEAEKVSEEEKPPPKKELEKAVASTVTVEGDENANLAAPIVDKNAGAVESAPVVESKVFDFVEQMPEFPGGETKLAEYLSKNIKYPKQANENGIQGRVVLSFIVNEDGNITDIKVVRGIGYGCDQEAMRVVNGMPNWKPGRQNGKPVRVSFNLPIMFQLEE
ncbi:MAG: energy transducer TonB, partial [Chitinophagaceae bacterium]|nr:energy transducer TonB [Chitinophagaceae bacterium]